MKVKKSPKMKNVFTVLCHRIDCEDEETFVLEGAECCKTVSEARKLMKEDFWEMRVSYFPKCGADSKTDPCTTRKEKDEIWFDVPIWDWDGENGKDSWIHCHWKVVKF